MPPGYGGNTRPEVGLDQSFSSPGTHVASSGLNPRWGGVSGIGEQMRHVKRWVATTALTALLVTGWVTAPAQAGPVVSDLPTLSITVNAAEFAAVNADPVHQQRTMVGLELTDPDPECVHGHAEPLLAVVGARGAAVPTPSADHSRPGVPVPSPVTLKPRRRARV